MENRQILILLVAVLLSMPMAACATVKGAESTAIVIDAESGKPIEGAIALAQWFRAASGGLFEGGMLNLEKAQEAYSDKDGKVNIDGFWGLFFFSGKPRLTVYKPGYVLWDCQDICPFGERTDFDEKHRTVKLLKFDTEAARWLKEGYDVGRGGPRNMQDSFFHNSYSGQISIKYPNNEIKFQDIFRKYELPFIKQEDKEAQEKKK